MGILCSANRKQSEQVDLSQVNSFRLVTQDSVKSDTWWVVVYVMPSVNEVEVVVCESVCESTLLEK